MKTGIMRLALGIQELAEIRGGLEAHMEPLLKVAELNEHEAPTDERAQVVVQFTGLGTQHLRFEVYSVAEARAWVEALFQDGYASVDSGVTRQYVNVMNVVMVEVYPFTPVSSKESN